MKCQTIKELLSGQIEVENLKSPFIIQLIEVRTYEKYFTVLKKLKKEGSLVN
jgi:hypothetical protein